jgi:flagellar protein FliS
MSSNATPAALEYLRAAVLSATPLRLVVLCYDGALRHLRAALRQLEAGDAAATRGSLLRAHDIVSELIGSLDPKAASALVADLERDYRWVLRRITEANLTQRTAAIEDAVRVLDVLRSAWAELESLGHDGITRRA